MELLIVIIIHFEVGRGGVRPVTQRGEEAEKIFFSVTLYNFQKSGGDCDKGGGGGGGGRGVDSLSHSWVLREELKKDIFLVKTLPKTIPCKKKCYSNCK